MKSHISFVGIPNRVKFAIKIFLVLASLIYFAFHTINGENGARSYFIIKKQVTAKKNILEKLKQKEISLINNVNLLSPQGIDPDLLEERCRTILNYAFEDDIIIDESSVYTQ